MTGRSRDVATPAELGQDGRPDPLDALDVAPKDRRHDLETIDTHDGPPVERCVHCERVGHPGAIDPFAACPDRCDGEADTDADTKYHTVNSSWDRELRSHMHDQQ